MSFRERAGGVEYIDEGLASESLTVKTHRLMRLLNRFSGSRRIVERFIEAQYRACGPGRRLTVLDLGAGSCDIPLAIVRRARRKGMNLQFTCVDRSAPALAMARQQIAASGVGGIELVQADICQYRPAEPFDCAVGSLFFHHFADEQIVDMIKRLRGYVRQSLLINDLHRAAGPYLACGAMRPFLPGLIWHDAMLSVKRGFRPDQLRQLLQQADPSRLDIDTHWFGRISATLWFDSETAVSHAD